MEFACSRKNWGISSGELSRSGLDGLGVAKGVDGHALVLVDLWHFLVLGVAEQRHHGHLFGSVGPGDEQPDQDSTNEQAKGASNDGQTDGQANDGDGEEEGNRADAQPRDDVFTPRVEERGFTGFERITDAFVF